MKKFILGALFVIVLYSGWKLGFIDKIFNKADDVFTIQSNSPTTTPIPHTPGPNWDGAVQAIVATQAAATAQVSGLFTPEPTAVNPTTGPSPTPQPVIIFLKGDINGTRNLLSQQDLVFTNSIVEAGYWSGVAYGDGSSGKLNYQSIKTGWFLLDNISQRLGQWMFDGIFPDQEIRAGIQGSGTVIAGFRLSDLIPVEIQPIDEKIQVVCGPSEQNAVCYKQPARVVIKANLCYSLEHVSKDTKLFVYDDASRSALIAGEIMGEPPAFRTANSLQVAWADFYNQVITQEHLDMAGYQAVENLKEGSLHEGLVTLMKIGGWSDVDLQVDIVNDWRGDPRYCLDNSPVR